MSLTIIFVLALHLIADFILQPNWIQTYKSRDNLVLLLHVIIYTYVLSVGALLLASWKAALLFGVVNGILHYVVDFVTSRVITHHAKKLELQKQAPNEEKPLFERVNLYSLSALLGIDQLLHQACLVVTISFLL
jgi:hypothetical protein